MIKKVSIFRQAVAVAMMLSMVIAFSIQPVSAGEDGWGVTTHIGKYYFKYHYGKERVYVSTKKSSGFKKTPINDTNFVSNGKEIMYVDNSGSKSYIKSYTISTRKTRNVKKLPKGNEWSACAARGSYLWIDNEKDVYRYSIKSKKLKRVKKDAGLRHLKGSYYLCFYGKETKWKKLQYEFEEGTGVASLSYCKAAIVQATKSGKLKTVKSLGNVSAVSGEMYYVYNYGRTKSFCYSTSDARKVYRIKYNGKGKQLVATIDDGYIVNVYNDICSIVKDGIAYDYNYKSKTLTKGYL